MQSNKQLINTIVIILGAGLLIFSFAAEGENKYTKIGGLVVLMYGLYKATNTWVVDNKTGKNDDDDESRGQSGSN